MKSYQVFPDLRHIEYEPSSNSTLKYVKIISIVIGAGFIGIFVILLLMMPTLMVLSFIEWILTQTRGGWISKHFSLIMDTTLTVLIICYPIAIILSIVFSVRDYRNKIKNAKEKIQKKRIDEAQQVTSRAIALLEESSSLFLSLSEMLNKSSAAIKRARVEYKENAFGPFWHKVQEAADYLAIFNSSVQKLSQNTGHYYESLKGRNHNFSSFPVRPESLPDSSAVVKEFNHVVRMGQTNHQFAMIWEQMETREVLIAGFRTLGEAVNNLGTVIDNSISDLKSSFSSDIARLVDEQIRTRETIAEHASEQSQMLDNIQHRRKPF